MATGNYKQAYFFLPTASFCSTLVRFFLFPEKNMIALQNTPALQAAAP